MIENAGSRALCFLTGLGIGALIGTLFAPHSGEETCEYLAEKADRGKEYAQKKTRELRERAGEAVERGKQTAARYMGFPAEPGEGREGDQPNRSEAQREG